MKNHYSIESRPSRVNKYRYGMLGTKWLALLLFVIISGSCKKVIEEQGLIGVCPVVVSTDPSDKAVDVALAKLVSATFNTDMSPATITAASFSIKQGAQIISGTVAPTATGTTFTFKPDVALLPFTKYTGTITTTATDKFRTAMVTDYVWSFTTIPQLTVAPNLAAGGTVTGAGTFAQGSTVTVSATPKSGYTFTNWTDSAGTTRANASKFL